MELEGKLAEYRARKRKGLLVKKVKSSFHNVFSWIHDKRENKMNSQENVTIIDDDCDCDNSTSKLLTESISGSTESISSEAVEENCCNWSKFILYVLLWCSLFGLAVFAEFGAVFIILSGFVLIWANTRTGPKKRGEISAYSVFNPNCEAIEGTLDAKQLEKEMVFGRL